MIKSKSFFLLVLFSFFGLNSHDHEHKKCERKKSLIQKTLTIGVIGFSMAHIVPIFGAIATNESVIASIFAKIGKGGDEAAPLLSALKTAGGTAINNALRHLGKRSKKALFAYIPGLVIGQGLATLICKPIF